MSRLYLSDATMTKYTTSLDQVLYDTYSYTSSPMSDNEVGCLSHCPHPQLTTLQLVDIFKVESQPSTYIANVLINGFMVLTYITFNKGASWHPLKIPTNSKYSCRSHGSLSLIPPARCDDGDDDSGRECSLHLALQSINMVCLKDTLSSLSRVVDAWCASAGIE
jgi:hypothetical protein